MAPNDDDFGAQYEANSQREHLFALVLFAGLVVELCAGFFWYRGLETIVGTAATVLIVIGVGGEILFGHRARLAGDKQLAQYEARTAEATARAATLEKEAIDTKLQYERLKAAVSWRTIEPDDFERLTRGLALWPSVVWLEYVRGDPETQNLAVYLRGAFMNAGWKVTLHARVYLGAAVGIWILPNATPSESTDLSVSTARDAFTSIGLSFGSEGGPAGEPTVGETWGPHSPPVKVIVGARPEPGIAEAQIINNAARATGV